MSEHDKAVERELRLSWGLDLDYLTVARFAQLVVARAYEHVAESSWATARMTLEGLLDRSLYSLRDRSERAAVLDLTDEVGADCLVHLSLRYGRAHLRAAARSVDALSAAKAWLQYRYPVAQPEESDEVEISFWLDDPHESRTTRSIAVRSWDDIAGNYPSRVSAALESLVARRFEDEHAGRLILWHGEPGTGKTHALRALAWEWRKWCSFHYITDPETFFGERPRYMLDVLLDEDDDDAEWRLLILEDTGELLALDAKRQTGQGLSRLLNVVDGLIGQGLRVLVLVTTNEPLRVLHPAVTRPGRCIAEIEFSAFPAEDADEWLERHGRAGDGTARTLASLFGGDATRSRHEKPTVGFSLR